MISMYSKLFFDTDQAKFMILIVDTQILIWRPIKWTNQISNKCPKLFKQNGKPKSQAYQD